MSTFHPYPPDPKPCWHCTRFLALTAQGSAAVCARPTASAPTGIVATPRRGCAFFIRETGADDEPDWVPQSLTTEQTQRLVAARAAAPDTSMLSAAEPASSAVPASSDRPVSRPAAHRPAAVRRPVPSGPRRQTSVQQPSQGHAE